MHQLRDGALLRHRRALSQSSCHTSYRCSAQRLYIESLVSFGLTGPGHSLACSGRIAGSPCVAKLQIDAAVVPDALCVLEIHDHALHGFEHEVHAPPDGRIRLRSSGTGASPYNSAAPPNSVAPHRGLNDRRSSTSSEDMYGDRY